MKKTYWWRLSVLLIGFSFSCYWILSVNIVPKSFFSFTEPVGYLSISLLISAVFLFFISDFVFKKWLRFALIWFILSIMWIVSVPTYDSGMFSMMNFTKGIVARLMSVLFVPVSLGVIFFFSRKEKKSVR